jgi:hypothetical protein
MADGKEGCSSTPAASCGDNRQLGILGPYLRKPVGAERARAEGTSDE